jgi:hypothetical protein
LTTDGSTLSVRGGQHHSVVSGSLEVLDGEHELAFLRRCQPSELPRFDWSCVRGAAHCERPASLAQIRCGDFADHLDPWFDQIVFDE